VIAFAARGLMRFVRDLLSVTTRFGASRRTMFTSRWVRDKLRRDFLRYSVSQRIQNDETRHLFVKGRARTRGSKQLNGTARKV